MCVWGGGGAGVCVRVTAPWGSAVPEETTSYITRSKMNLHCKL